MMTTVNAAGSGTYDTGTAAKKTGAMQELGKDVFLQLMVTQLKYQDPLNPQDNGAFVAQMAQFTSLEQMQNLNETVTKLLEAQNSMYAGAPALIGRQVEVFGEAGLITGKVDAIVFDLGKPKLMVDGLKYGMEALQKVFGGEE